MVDPADYVTARQECPECLNDGSICYSCDRRRLVTVTTHARDRLTGEMRPVVSDVPIVRLDADLDP